MTLATASKIGNLVNAVGALFVAVVDLLPAAWAAKVHSGRKTAIAVLGGTTGVLTALEAANLPPNVAAYVSSGLVVVTGLLTWLVPNAEAG